MEPSKEVMAFRHKAKALESEAEYERAIVCCNRAIKLDPKDATTHFHKGTTLYKIRKMKEAINCYDRAINLNPKQENWKEIRQLLVALTKLT